ncbi:alkaline phosphatase [Nocardia terrae]|uniref:alkaline phosphatase n=1 Tax=Nocardia terrae TaxID=2675851 RepID=UPI0018DF434A|nr:alkaline phosphatase [Nocardia terrae]
MQNRKRAGLGAIAAATAAVAGASLVAGCGSETKADNEVRNIIYLLGDGMGRSHVTAARQRFVGAGGRLTMEQLPYVGAVSTYAVEPGSAEPSLVTDSASAATAWASGVKTYNAAIGVDAFGKAVPTLMEQAKAAGFATGNVSTAEITDATPAAMVSHTLLRGCQGPTYSESTCLPKKSEGGYEAQPADKTLVTPIAEQIARGNTADVLFGGGLARFEPEDQKAMQDNGYEVLGSMGDPALKAQTPESQRVATAADLKAVTAKKVIGLFNRGNMTVTNSRDALPDSAPQKQEPTLAAMTTKAIDLLSNTKGGKGFLLQVEGALIDKRSHANDAAQTLDEVKAFDDAVAAAVDFAKKDGHTMVIVTADHECAGFNIIEKGTFTNAEAVAPPTNVDATNPANNGKPGRDGKDNVKDPARSTGVVNGAGQADPRDFAPATFRTPDDPAEVKDGSPEASLWLTYLSGNHTGADVQVYAYGPGAQVFAANQDNTSLYAKMHKALLP